MGNTDSVHDVEMNSLSNVDNDRPYIKVIINLICVVVVVVVGIEWNDYVTFKCRRVFEQLKFLNRDVVKGLWEVGHWGINENGATGVLFVHETITKERH